MQVSVHLQVLPDVGVHAHSGWMKLNGNRLIVDVILFFVTDSVIVQCLVQFISRDVLNKFSTSFYLYRYGH